MKINGRTEFSTSEALKWYGISMQGLHGDNKAEEPSIFDIVAKMKWSAYEANKGMERVKARTMFVNHAEEVLKQHGFSSENPEKAKMDKEYKECVARKLSSGKT